MQPHPSIALWAGNNEDEHDMYIADKPPAPPGFTPADIEAYVRHFLAQFSPF